MIKMIAMERTYYAQRHIPAAELFDVESDEHADIFETSGKARRWFGEVQPMTTENASPIMKRGRGRPRKNPIEVQ